MKSGVVGSYLILLVRVPGMSHRHERSSLLTGVVVGVWIVGYLVALIVVAVAILPPVADFSVLGYAGALHAFGTVFALPSLAGSSYPIPMFAPAVAGLFVAAAGGAVVSARTGSLDGGWAATKAGVTVGFGVFLTAMTVLAAYLTPSTPVSNTPVSVRYLALFFGNLLLPSLFGALGGATRHALATR